jgi:peptidoglycan/LPS O-acetylase OafA/YrhL
MGITLPKRIPELDGFRGIAVLMVMTEHIYEAGPPSGMPSPFHFLLTHGWLGVDLFFVLSGFLITGILLDECKRKDYFQSFYRRRALRILPLALTCLCLYSLIYHHRYDRPFAISFLLTFFFCANLNILFGVLPAPGVAVMWSLAVEEHFYLVWPVVIRRLSLRKVGYIAAAIVLLSPVVRGLAMHYGVRALSVYQLSWFRFDGLALGALLAVFVRTRHFTIPKTWIVALGWLGIILIATLMLRPYGVLAPKSTLGEALRYTQAQALFGVAMAICLAHQGSAWTSCMRSRFLAWVAALSYCLYLIHMAIGDLYYWTLHHIGFNDIEALGTTGALLARYAVILPVCFALAALSGKYLEGPFLRMRPRAQESDSAGPVHSPEQSGTGASLSPRSVSKVDALEDASHDQRSC